MTFLALCLLALVQGLTEFLPVSSSGHLVLVRALMGIELAHPLVVDVALHVGTLLAVVAVFHRDVAALLRAAVRLPVNLRSGSDADESTRLLLTLALGTLPAAIVGLFLGDWIELHLTYVAPVGAALLLTALVLGGADARRRRGGAQDLEIGFGRALLIGCAQALAIVPGCSRSGWTIAMAVLLGVEARRGARFSFLLALPAVGGAALIQGKRILDGSVAVDCDGTQLLVAVLVSALTGYAACRGLLLVLRRGALRWFGLYCALVGLGALVWALF